MALNKEFFDSIQIDVVKQKYYNANKVNAVFARIRSEAEALTEENERLRAQAGSVDSHKAELGEAVFSAQAICKNLIDQAQARADEIVAEAERRAEEIEKTGSGQIEHAVQRAERCFTRMKETHERAIDEINGLWQAFLSGLYPEEPPAVTPPAPASVSTREPEIPGRVVAEADPEPGAQHRRRRQHERRERPAESVLPAAEEREPQPEERRERTGESRGRKMRPRPSRRETESADWGRDEPETPSARFEPEPERPERVPAFEGPDESPLPDFDIPPELAARVDALTRGLRFDDGE